MKKFQYLNIFKILLATAILSGCNDFLDRAPLSSVTSDDYLVQESQLASYTINNYDVFPTHNTSGGYGNIFGEDVNSDNQAQSGSAPERFVPSLYKVPEKDGEWAFGKIRECNYFFNLVLPRYEAGKLSGNADNIKHYIGEMYFIRAYEYFTKLQKLGDFPIITTVIPNNQQELTQMSKRAPRNEVARFILSDLDKAIEMMLPTSIDGKKNRLSRPCAQLLKSRVALYEATWLKYFKGTAFVPNGTGWPGAVSNGSYQYPSGSIEAEITYFLNQALTAADAVASTTTLTVNTGLVRQDISEPVNPYMDMFSDVNLEGYSEVLLWRKYDTGLNIKNNIPVEACTANGGTGFTRGFVDCFLMANGLPTYDASVTYDDQTIANVRTGRDNRLFLFLKEPGQKNILMNLGLGTHGNEFEPAVPRLIGDRVSCTAYLCRKGINPDGLQFNNLGGFIGSTIFSGVEAYLNYIEAYYELNGTIAGQAATYWTAIRDRAKLPSYTVTIAATDVSKEVKNDWAAYSGSTLVDATLYSIRRERRSELMAGGLRFMDLCRWRAMDRMITTPYQIEGMNLWGGPTKDAYPDGAGGTKLKYGGSDANVSSPALSDHVRPYQILTNATAYDGYKWKMGHYLSPIANKHFQLTSPSGVASESVIYQNPGWGYDANTNATL